ncbi:MAG: integrase core domain-containing protein [Planctomycetota bacterium]|jgi:putative transposase
MSTLNTYTTNTGVFQEFLALIGRMVHGELVRQLEYLKVENQILRGKLGRRVYLKPSEKRRLIKFGLPLKGDIKKFMSIVSYSTFRRWVNNGACSKYIYKRGRPRKNSKEIRELVVRLARENHWGYTSLDPAPKRSEDTWDDFIKRHFKTLWACDFFTKTVWTMLGPKTFHILFFINVLTRKVHVAGMTKNPTREWVNSKAKTVSFIFKTGNKSNKLLIRDGDGKYSKEFDEIFKKLNVNVKKIPYKSPNLNPYAEGFVSVIKRECLDYFFVFGERHLMYLVKGYLKYYNSVRPHGSLDNMPLGYKAGKVKGKIKCESRLGGVVRHYYRE